MKMWNFLDIECPKMDLVTYPPQDNYLAENLQEFVTVLSTAADTLTSENPLWGEMNVLSNIQAKYKRILRCDKCLVFLQRISHCLKKMVLLNLSKSYLDLAERFLVGFQGPLFTYQLPSQQQVEYILMRTLTSSKLVVEAIKYSQEAFCFLIRKLKVGHLILDLVMATSVTARMNILLRGTLEHLCSIYKQVIFWRHKVKRGSFEWKEKISLPLDLEEWLKHFEPGYFKPLPMSPVEIEHLKVLLNQTENENGVKSDAESIIVIDDDIEKADAPISAKRMHDVDCGEVIPRKKTKISQNQINGVPRKKTEISHNQINGVPKKKTKITHNQINGNKPLLQQILELKSLKGLYNLWYDICDLPQDYFPSVMSEARKGAIDKFISSIKTRIPEKRFNKIFQNKPPIFKSAISLFCK